MTRELFDLYMQQPANKMRAIEAQLNANTGAPTVLHFPHGEGLLLAPSPESVDQALNGIAFATALDEVQGDGGSHG